MKVVNVRSAVPGSFVYIGRKVIGFAGSKWCNPYREGRDGNREVVIHKYKVELWKKMKSKDFCNELLSELDGNDLGCWCAPLACHGEVLIAAIGWLKLNGGVR